MCSCKKGTKRQNKKKDLGRQLSKKAAGMTERLKEMVNLKAIIKKFKKLLKINNKKISNLIKMDIIKNL